MDTFQVAGLALLVTAIVGGGMQAAGHSIPVITSLVRQVLLGLLGAVLLVSGQQGFQAVIAGVTKGPGAAATVTPVAVIAPPTATQSPPATFEPTATLVPTVVPTTAPTVTYPPATAPTPAAARHWCRPTRVTDAIAMHARPTSASQWLGTIPAPSAAGFSEATVIGWSEPLRDGDIPWFRISEIKGPSGEVSEARAWIRSREPATPSGWVDMACSFDPAQPPFPLPRLAPDA